MAAIYKDQRFPSYGKFKEAVEDWAIDANFSTRTKKSELECVVVGCAIKNCPFHLRAVFSAKLQCVIVTAAQDQHTCVGAQQTGRGPESKQSWIQRILPETISVRPDTTPRQIIEAIQLRWKKTINYQAAKTAKQIALKGSDKAHANQFKLLPAYIACIQSADPGAHTHLSIENREGTHRFQRIFISPSACRKSFPHCQFFISMDGTFMKEVFGLTVLLAVAVDADNHGVLIAWAIVEGESEKSWRYFLAHLKIAIPKINHSSATIMSDRDKGLIAADDEIPLAGRAFCTEHLSRNIGTKFGLASRTAFNDHIRFTKTEHGFRVGLEAICTINSRTATYIEQTIDINLWASPFLLAKRYGHNTSNIVESVNGHLIQERKLAILDFLQALWNKTMNNRYERSKNMMDNTIYPIGSVLTKYSSQILETSLTAYNATQRIVQFSSPTQAIVSTYAGTQYTINLETRKCSCGLFQEYDIPCAHAISCIYESGGAPRDWIPYNLTLSAYRSIYSLPNLPLLDISNIVPALEPNGDTTCLPPISKQKKRGRPQIARKKQGRQSTRAGTQKCTRCAQPGHSILTCKALPV